MKAFVGVTDLAWYAQLQAASSDHDEVNFWFPSARQGFSAISTGEFFIFKTHVDRRQPDLSNRIVGVGIFSGYARLRVSEAWKWFGLGNGTGSLSELKNRIERYRRSAFESFDDPEIGCAPHATFPFSARGMHCVHRRTSRQQLSEGSSMTLTTWTRAMR